MGLGMTNLINHRIETLDFVLRIVGVRYTVQERMAFEEVPAIWQQATASGLLQRLIDMSWEKPKCQLESLLGACIHPYGPAAEKLDYFLGVRYDGQPADDMEVVTIPAATWAVLPDALAAWKALNSWLSTSGHQLINLPQIECHYPPNHNPPSELWLPIAA